MPTNKSEFTSEQLAAFRFIRNSLVHKNKTPTVKEVAEAVGFKSPRTGSNLVNELIEMGLLKRKSRNELQLLRKHSLNEESAQTMDVPIVGRVACGTPLLAEGNIQSLISIDRGIVSSGGDYFILRAEGSSMNKSGISDGDLVLVESANTAEEGDIVVALIDDEATLKRFHRRGGAVILEPNSTDESHKPIILSEDFRIQGVYKMTLPNINTN